MKKTILIVWALAAIVLSPAQAQELAFPGAEGYGKTVTGGRGGEVCYVTRNDDCSDTNLVPGTLRWALRHDNGGQPRTVLFATSGVIYLTSRLNLAYDNVSILGQSAPGGGICICGYKLYICKNNVIVRYVRFRAGDAINTNQTSLDIENCKHVIIDHCSMTWSMEECMTAYDTDSTTVQYCIIGEGLYNSKHDKGARAYAMQWGGEHSTMHHCLVTNAVNRTPLFNGVRSRSSKRGDHDYQVDSEFANNVIFNFGKVNASHGGACDRAAVPTLEGYGDPYDRLSVIANYYKAGPATAPNPYMVYADNGGEFYLRGNYAEQPMQELGKASSSSVRLTERPDSSDLAIQDAQSAYLTTLSTCGARLPRIDEVDQRIVAEARGDIQPQARASYGKAGIIDSPSDITLTAAMAYAANGIVHTDYPDIQAGEGDKYIRDSNGDGVPDGCPATDVEDYLNGIVDGRYSKSDYETEDYFEQAGWQMMQTPDTAASDYEDATYTYTYYGYEVCGRIYGEGEQVYAPAGEVARPVYIQTLKPWGEKHASASGKDTIVWLMDGPYEEGMTPEGRYNDIWDTEASVATIGSHAIGNGTNAKIAGATCAVFQPTAKSSAVDADAYVRFTLQPLEGMQFRLDSIRYRALMNSGSCSQWGKYAYGEEAETPLTAAGAKINASNNVYTWFEHGISAGTESEEPIHLTVYLYNTSTDKGMGIRDVTLYISWTDTGWTGTEENRIRAIRSTKQLRNGRIVVERNGQMYNLNGGKIQ